MIYNYHLNIKEDILQAIRDNYTEEEIKQNLSDDLYRQNWFEKLYDDFWTDDSVTGNGSGSYTFNTAKAQEYVLGNFDILKEACREFCCDGNDFFDKGFEWADVTIRCYLLYGCLDEALDELLDEIE